MSHEDDTVPPTDPIAGREALLAAEVDLSAAGTSTLLAGLSHHDPTLRSSALGCLARSGRLELPHLARGLTDQAAAVRRTAARVAPLVSDEQHAAVSDLLGHALDDPDRLVVIGALNAVGERQDTPLLDAVLALGSTSTDALIIEEAVACVAELGDPRGLAFVLRAADGKPALRRRCVAALGAFEGDEVEATLDRLAVDRDWQVRQAVAMLRRSERS